MCKNPDCNVVFDRDANAAVNVANKGFARVAEVSGHLHGPLQPPDSRRMRPKQDREKQNKIPKLPADKPLAR